MSVSKAKTARRANNRAINLVLRDLDIARDAFFECASITGQRDQPRVLGWLTGVARAQDMLRRRKVPA